MKELFDNCLKNLALLGVWNREEFYEIFRVLNNMTTDNYILFDEIDYTHPGYPDLYIVTHVCIFDGNGEEIATVNVKHLK